MLIRIFTCFLFFISLATAAQPISNDRIRWMDAVNFAKSDTIPFQNCQISGDVDINFNGMQQSAQFVMKMRSDSCIWVTIRALGLEGFRVMLTQDSVVILNRLQKNYRTIPLSSITQKIGQQATIGNVQQQLLGRMGAVTDLLDFIRLDTSTGNTQFFCRSISDSSKLIQLTQNNLRQWIQLDAVNDSSTGSIQMSQFQDVQGYMVPNRMAVYQNKDDGPILVLNYTQIILKNFETFPFKIPDSYLRIDEQ